METQFRRLRRLSVRFVDFEELKTFVWNPDNLRNRKLFFIESENWIFLVVEN